MVNKLADSGMAEYPIMQYLRDFVKERSEVLQKSGEAFFAGIVKE